jgi:hypothetical protein
MTCPPSRCGDQQSHRGVDPLGARDQDQGQRSEHTERDEGVGPQVGAGQEQQRLDPGAQILELLVT